LLWFSITLPLNFKVFRGEGIILPRPIFHIFSVERLYTILCYLF